jgi:hypothetical protein
MRYAVSRYDHSMEKMMKKPVASKPPVSVVSPPAPEDPLKAINRTAQGLRDVLFEEIEALRGPNPDPRKALAVSSLAKQIVNTVRVELDFARKVKEIQNAGGDVQVGTLALGTPAPAASAAKNVTAH